MTSWSAALDERSFEVREGESLLDACRRAAVPVSFSCTAGVCQTCLLKAVDGEIPSAAQKGLPQELSARGYVLACQCIPSGPMALVRPDPMDRRIDAMLHEAVRSGPFVYVQFETAREMACVAGDRLLMSVDATAPELELQVTAVTPQDCAIEALCPVHAQGADRLCALDFGAALQVRGPMDQGGGAPELSAPTPDPQLWAELNEGIVVQQVLTAFYRQVYADDRLSGFFSRVTIERSIEKQFSFLKQLMTGESCYFGDRPRNAHHWMVITPELFDHRQSLMRVQLRAHGLSETQIARWTRLEVHYRSDIVKSSPWPRRMNGVEIPADGYADEVLGEATVCDHCSRPLAAGDRVRYHVRLGTVNCEGCAPHGHE